MKKNLQNFFTKTCSPDGFWLGFAKILTLVVGALLAFFLSVNFAAAAEIIGYEWANSGNTCNVSICTDLNSNNDFGDIITASSSIYITSMYLPYWDTGVSHTIPFRIYHIPSGSSPNSYINSSNFIASGTIVSVPYGSATSSVNITNGTANLISGEKYFFLFSTKHDGSGLNGNLLVRAGATMKTWGWTTNNGVWDGSNSSNWGASDATWSQNLATTMTIYGTSNAPTPSLTLTFPTSSTAEDFSLFHLNLGSGWRTYDLGSYSYLGVQYGLSSSTLNYNDNMEWNPFISSLTPSITKSRSLWFPPLATTTIWYFRPYMQYENGLYTGDIVSSTISAIQTSFNNNNWAYSSSSGFSTTTDYATSTLYPGYSPTQIPQFGAATSTCPDGITICTLQFLFIPGSNFTSYLTNGFTSMQNVFPFNLFFATIEDVRNATATSTPASLTMDIPQTDFNATTSITILSPTLLKDKTSITFVNLWYNSILTILGAAIGAGLIKIII